MRADSGFYNHLVVEACERQGGRFCITTKMSPGLHKVIEAISEEDWVPIPYFLEGAAVAETIYTPFVGTLGRKKARAMRLIVCRVPPTPGPQLALYTEYGYHAFVTNWAGEMVELDADHRRHAVVEATIRDLKYRVGLNHLPSGASGPTAPGWPSTSWPTTSSGGRP